MLELDLPDNLRPPRLGPSSEDLTDRGREILDGLGDIFVEEGFMHLTISDLAERMSCSRRTLYDLAPNRTELVLIVCDRRLRRIGRVAAEYLRSIDEPLELLEQFMMVGHSEVHHATARFAEDAARTPAVARLTSSYYRYHVAILRAILDYGIANGAFRPINSVVVANLVDRAYSLFSDPEFARESGLTFEDATTELVTLLRFALKPEPGSRSGQAASRRHQRARAKKVDQAG